MNWYISLSGDESCLAHIAKSFAQSELKFSKDRDGWCVSGGWIDDCVSCDDCTIQATDWVKSLNGALMFMNGCAEPVVFSDIYQENEQGHIKYYLSFHDTIRMSSSLCFEVIHKDGTVESYYPAMQVAEWMQVMESNQTLKTVFHLMGEGDKSWVNLYRIFEVIKADLGGQEDLLNKNWVTKQQLNRFTQTANHPAIIGHEARHGHNNAALPKNPMNHAEAMAFVVGLVNNWISYLKGLHK